MCKSRLHGRTLGACPRWASYWLPKSSIACIHAHPRCRRWSSVDPRASDVICWVHQRSRVALFLETTHGRHFSLCLQSPCSERRSQMHRHGVMCHNNIYIYIYVYIYICTHNLQHINHTSHHHHCYHRNIYPSYTHHLPVIKTGLSDHRGSNASCNSRSVTLAPVDKPTMKVDHLGVSNPWGYPKSSSWMGFSINQLFLGISIYGNPHFPRVFPRGFPHLCWLNHIYSHYIGFS